MARAEEEFTPLQSKTTLRHKKGYLNIIHTSLYNLLNVILWSWQLVLSFMTGWESSPTFSTKRQFPADFNTHEIFVWVFMCPLNRVWLEAIKMRGAVFPHPSALLLLVCVLFLKHCTLLSDLWKDSWRWNWVCKSPFPRTNGLTQSFIHDMAQRTRNYHYWPWLLLQYFYWSDQEKELTISGKED